MIITEIRDGHIHEHVGRELTDDELARIAKRVAKTEGVRVEPVVDVFHVLHLWALAPCDTRQEVRAIAAFQGETDARLAWHKAAS